MIEKRYKIRTTMTSVGSITETLRRRVIYLSSRIYTGVEVKAPFPFSKMKPKRPCPPRR